MSLQVKARGRVDAGASSALTRLVAIDPDDFAGEHWGRAPLLSRAAELPGDFADLLSLDAVDELVSRRGLRTPFLRVAKDGQTVPGSSFTASGGVGAGVADQLDEGRLLRLFADGCTIVLQGLHRTWEPLADFTSALADELGHPVQANAYVTPRQSTGFSDHYDGHDVFVLQVAGEKAWRIREPVVQWPSRDDPWTSHRELVSAATGSVPTLEEVLRPGDCLYLPRGYLHSATATDGVSAHITLGVHTWTRQHLADSLVAQALRTVSEIADNRAPLPLGTDIGDEDALADDLEAVRTALTEALTAVDPSAVAEQLDRTARSAARPGPLGPIAQASRAEALTAHDVVRLRPHLRPRLVERSGGGLELRSRAGTVHVAAADRAAIRELLDTGRLDVAHIGLAAARRLVRAGVVV